MRVAAAQPPCSPGDVSANARAHADAVRAAGARLVVFPELSLTGYELDAPALAPDDPALAPLVEACAATGALALAGAPVAGEGGREHIAVLAVDGDGVRIAYRKCFPGGAEPGRFAPGDGPAVLDVDGWRLGLGVCRDTGVEEHVREVAARGVDLYAAGLAHRPEELGGQDARGARIARACDAHVVFASFAGPTGEPFDRTAGTSTIWSPAGEVLDRAGAEPGGLARAEIA